MIPPRDGDWSRTVRSDIHSAIDRFRRAAIAHRDAELELTNSRRSLDELVFDVTQPDPASSVPKRTEP